MFCSGYKEKKKKKKRKSGEKRVVPEPQEVQWKSASCRAARLGRHRAAPRPFPRRTRRQ